MFLQDDVFLETATCFNWQTQIHVHSLCLYCNYVTENLVGLGSILISVLAASMITGVEVGTNCN